MYLIAIAWIYVVLMMSVAEATNTTGTVLGAIVTFFLYGVLPLSLVMYLLKTPDRRRANKAREQAETLAAGTPRPPTASDLPDAGSHAAGAAPDDGVPPVRKET